MLAGDWNFDTCVEDRVDPISGEFVGKPSCEYDLWKNTFRCSFVALYQGDWTRAAGHGFAQSRLDRIFSSLHPVTLSDMVVATEIVGLSRFDKDLSDHKPVCALLRPKTHQSLFPEGYLPGYQNKHAGRQVLLNNLVSYVTCPVNTSLYNYLVSRLRCAGVAIAVREIGRKPGAVI